MKHFQLAIVNIACLAISYVLAQAAPPLRITTIASHNGYSVLECWQIDSTPVEYMAALNYAIGGRTTNVKWSTLPPRTYVGEAWAPHVQYAIFLEATPKMLEQLTIVLNGMIRVSAPYTPSQPSSSNTSATGGCLERADPGIPQPTAFVMSNKLLYQGPIPTASVDSPVPARQPPEEVAYLMPGTMTSSIILVTDLRSQSTVVGHGAEFPSNEHTVLVQVPFENDEIPAHTVIGTGSCSNYR